MSCPERPGYHIECAGELLRKAQHPPAFLHPEINNRHRRAKGRKDNGQYHPPFREKPNSKGNGRGDYHYEDKDLEVRLESGLVDKNVKHLERFYL